MVLLVMVLLVVLLLVLLLLMMAKAKAVPREIVREIVGLQPPLLATQHQTHHPLLLPLQLTPVVV
jgi:hypothetical protein